MLMLAITSVILGLLVWLTHTASLYISTRLPVLSQGVNGKLFYKDLQHKTALSTHESSMLYTKVIRGFTIGSLKESPVSSRITLGKAH